MKKRGGGKKVELMMKCIILSHPVKTSQDVKNSNETHP